MNVVTTVTAAIANGALAVVSFAADRARLLILAATLLALTRQELAAHRRETRKFKVEHV